MGIKNESHEATFVNFVERTIFRTKNLQSFRLWCFDKHDAARINTCILAALSLNLHHLDVYFPYGNTILPRDILNFLRSLRKLHLAILPCFTFKVHSKIFFPNLTSLELVGVKILNELSDSDRLVFNLPVLERFELSVRQWLNVKFVEVYAPKMTNFKFENLYNAGENDRLMKITGESLVHFECRGDLAENIVLSGGSAIVDAVIEIDYYGDDLVLLEKSELQTLKLLKGFSGLKELELTGCVGKVQ